MKLGSQVVKSGAILIGLFIIGAHLSGWGGLMINAGKAGNGIVRNLQGRS